MIKLKDIKKKQEKEADKLHDARLKRCIPVARDINRLLASKIDEMPMGDDVQTSTEYDKVAVDVLALLLKANINWSDRQFVLQLALQPISFVKDIVDNAMAQSWSRVVTGLFKKPASELLMSDVDAALKEGEKIEEKAEAMEESASAEVVEEAAAPAEAAADPVNSANSDTP